jgi:predicted peptidase
MVQDGSMFAHFEAGVQAHPAGTDDPLPYLLHRPAVAGPVPLLLFLHGAGERGHDLRAVVAQGLPKRVEEGTALPFMVLAPQCPVYGSWQCELTALNALLDEVVGAENVDPDRVYVTGLSMGAMATWAMVARYPGRFAAAAPISAGWIPECGPRLAGTPVWTFHGDADDVVPMRQTEDMVAAVGKAGGDVRFTRYPGVGHDAWTRTYADPQLYRWLLTHRRGGSPSAGLPGQDLGGEARAVDLAVGAER